MANILATRALPSEFKILSAGTMRTEYGVLNITEKAILDAVSKSVARNRQIGSDIEHRSNSDRNPNPLPGDLDSPLWFSLEARRSRRKMELWAVNVTYSPEAARKIVNGVWRMPQMRPVNG